MNEFNIKSEAQKQEIVNYLRGLGLSKIKPDCEQFGICLNLSAKFDGITDYLIAYLSVEWDKHSGDPFYRRELCLYIADKLETMELKST